MLLKNTVICTGIKESAGEYEGRKFSSTTFHLIVDIKENGAGRSIGTVTRPFKFGDAAEFEKWAHLAKSWPAAGVPCDCTFELVAGAGNDSRLELKEIKPAKQA